MRHLMSPMDFSVEELEKLMDLAGDIEKNPEKYAHACAGKKLATLFFEPSTRTRLSFEAAMYELGGNVLTVAGADSSSAAKGESIADTARVLGRMYEGIEYRGYGQEIVEELAKYAGVPVWNGLTNEFHPTQMLADLLTIREHFGRVKGIKLTYMGDARYNMGNSLMVACAKMGMHFTACTDKKYFPEEALVKTCREIAKENGGSIRLTEDVAEGVTGADVVYTDVWVSMGEPEQIWEERLHDLSPYQVNAKAMALAGKDAVFMHCLPAFHDHETSVGKEIGEKYGMAELEVTDEVFESPQSIVFEEAENRMHTIKAVMAVTLAR